MSCPCKNIPQPPNSHQSTLNYGIDSLIRKNISKTPINGTHSMNVKCIIGDKVLLKGTGLLSYSTNEDGSVTHYFQTNFEGTNSPFISPISGRGFFHPLSYESHNNTHDVRHNFLYNRLDINDKEGTYHIQATPSVCACNGGTCFTPTGGMDDCSAGCDHCLQVFP